MGLSKNYLGMNAMPVRFSLAILATSLEEAFPHISFAYLLGSGQDGTIRPRGDLDLAVYFAQGLRSSLELYGAIQDLVESVVGPVRCDLGILNGAEPVYRYEAMKGKLLFARNREVWLRYYSLTCREYEGQIVHYEKQRRYRLEAKG